MAKMENNGKCKSSDNQTIAFFCLSMISVLCTGSGYEKKKINPCKSKVYRGFSLFLLKHS